MKSKARNLLVYTNFTLFMTMIFFSLFATTKLFSISGRYFQISFYVSFLALPLFYFSYFFIFKNHSIDFIFPLLISLFAILFLSSLGMGYILKPKFDGLFNSSPEKEVMKSAIKYAYDLAVIPYFAFMVSFLERKVISRVINSFLIIWILFGLWQILVFIVNSQILWTVYDQIDFLKIIGGNSTIFQKIRHNYGFFRFYGFAEEPASNCILVSAFLLPYLFYKCTRKVSPLKNKVFYLIMSFFVLLFSFLTKSSSVYVGIAVDFFYLLVVLIKNKKISFKAAIITACSLMFLLVIGLLIPTTRNVILNNFLLKIIDKGNYSTQHRYSTIYNDLLIFIKSPIFGIGDGNQGYYYAENIIGTWMSENAETQSAIKGEMGLLSGGASIPSFLSGFGIGGITLITLSYRLIVSKEKSQNKNWHSIKYYFMVALLAVLFLSTATSGFHRNYLMILVLVLPFLFHFDKNSSKQTLSMINVSIKCPENMFTEYSL